MTTADTLASAEGATAPRFCSCAATPTRVATPTAMASPSAQTEEVAEQDTGMMSLEAGEQEQATFETADGVVSLTDRRILLKGDSESPTVWAAIPIGEVATTRIDRVPRGNRAWIWFAVGVAVTIATWQILDGGGYLRLAMPGTIGFASLVLLAYALMSPQMLRWTVTARGGASIEARVPSGKLDELDAFGGEVMRSAKAAQSIGAVTSRAGSDQDDPIDSGSADPE